MNKNMQHSLSKRSRIHYVILAIKGICMGAADIIPGVSGGTMAFILGIYEELIASIRSCTQPPFWNALRQGHIKEAFRKINITFLILVGGGILFAIFSMAHTLEYLLETHPLFLWSFFFGLVSASIYIISRRIKKWRPAYWPAIIIGSVISYLIVGLVPIETPTTWWFLILSGSIAICAMILPGISGAFILLLLGKYAFILNAVNERDIVTIGLVGIGAILGLIAFSHVLGWLFHNYHNRTIVFLMGIMIGSLRKIWPWKTLDVPQANVFPSLYKENALNPDLMIGVMMILIGAVLVLLIEWMASRKEKNKHAQNTL